MKLDGMALIIKSKLISELHKLLILFILNFLNNSPEFLNFIFCSIIYVNIFWAFKN